MHIKTGVLAYGLTGKKFLILYCFHSYFDTHIIIYFMDPTLAVNGGFHTKLVL